MPNYFYTAKSFDGVTKTGTVYADSQSALAQSLKAEGLVLVTAVEGAKKKKSGIDFLVPSFGISSKEKILMTRNLWIMFGAGLSLVKIFGILAGQSKNTKLKSIMLDVNARLNKGENFSAALAQYPKVFDDFFLSMVKIGEESGTLEGIFEILSKHMDRAHELKSKIMGAMIYPIIVLGTMGVIGILISMFVLPKFTSFLLGMGIELPFYTKILIWISDFSQQYWYVVVAIPFAAAYIFFLAMKTKTGRLVRDTVLMKTPLLAPFVKKTNAAIIVRSLASLNASGISLVRSLEITSATVGNIYYKRVLIEAIEKIKKGDRLSATLRPSAAIFPFGAVDMMEVGEETGKTSEVLKRLAEFYEQEVIDQAKNFSVIIEPLLIIFLGLCVAFFAISIIAPMYSSFSSIG